MSAVLEPMGQSTGLAGWLDKERTIAGRGFNRWLVPPAALAIHLCIGMAYGFSVFWLPLSRARSGSRTSSRPKSARQASASQRGTGAASASPAFAASPR